MVCFTIQVKGTDYKTHDGTCIRDYIDVTDLVDAHVKALEKAMPGKVGIYNVGTGKGGVDSLNVHCHFSLTLFSQAIVFLGLYFQVDQSRSLWRRVRRQPVWISKLTIYPAGLVTMLKCIVTQLKFCVN